MSNEEKNIDKISLVMSLYEESQRVFNQSNDAFYISKNLEFLARCTESNEEIPLDTLYQLAEKLHNVGGMCTQPFLNEERLDALRDLLECGMSTERRACLADLTPEETVSFLLTCSDDAFVYAVEETAISNYDLYYPDTTHNFGSSEFSNDLEAFKNKERKSSLDERIADAAGRAGEQKDSHGKEQSMEK